MIKIVSENVSNIKTSKVAFFFYLKISTIVWVLAFYKRTVAVGLLKTYPEGAKCTCIGNTMSYIKWQHLCWQYIVHQKSRKKTLFSINFYILFKSPLFQHNALKDLFTYFNINSLLFKCDRIVWLIHAPMPQHIDLQFQKLLCFHNTVQNVHKNYYHNNWRKKKGNSSLNNRRKQLKFNYSKSECQTCRSVKT